MSSLGVHASLHEISFEDPKLQTLWRLPTITMAEVFAPLLMFSAARQ